MNHQYKIPCSLKKLEDVRAFIRSVLAPYNITKIDRNNIILAVDEVCANLMIHSHQCNENEFIELNIYIKNRSEITFEFVDIGVGFNISNYQEPSIKDIVNEGKKGGLGLILVKKIMDDINFSTKNNQNTCRLTKKINLK